MTRYEHTQIGHAIIWPLVAIILGGAFVGSWSHRQPPALVLMILVIALVLFYKLRISIDGETLCASFGIGIIRKKVRRFGVS